MKAQSHKHNTKGTFVFQSNSSCWKRILKLKVPDLSIKWLILIFVWEADLKHSYQAMWSVKLTQSYSAGMNTDLLVRPGLLSDGGLMLSAAWKLNTSTTHE